MLLALGGAAAAAMVGAYALEPRSPRFVLAFAAACLAAAAYALATEAWVFAALEVVWGGVALSRWRRAAAGAAPGVMRRSDAMTDVPIVCDMDAFQPGERERHAALWREASGRLAGAEAAGEGYVLRFRRTPGLPATLAEWASLERICCPFLTIAVEDGPEAGVVLRLSGPAGTRALLEAELGGAGGA